MPKPETNLKKVLIVDDDPIVCVVTSAIFTSAGAEQVIVAENGLKGLEIINNSNDEFDFILCDLNMPCLDGIEFLRHLGELKFGGCIAIISGEHKSIVDTAHQLAISHNLNIVGTFAKPINLKELKTTIISSSGGPQIKSTPVENEFSYEDIKTALDHGEIIAFYQPKLDVASNEIIGSEALARWQHPKHGLVFPDNFISVAERYGLIDQLTDAIFGCAVRDVAKWKNKGIELNTSVNISAESLNNLSLPDDLWNLVNSHGLSPQDFTLEITETGILERTTKSIEVITRLRIKGFGISIDDFGTGNSNIEQLREYPFSELKIDQSFIKQATTDDFARTCVETSISLARQLNLQLVAEGVENSDCWNYIKKAGIDIAQGYFIAKPMSGEDFFKWIHDRLRSSARRSLVG